MNALDAEARYIEKLIKSEQIDRETLYVAEEHIQRMRLAVTNRLQYRRLFIWTLIKRSIYRILYLIVPESKNRIRDRKVKAKKLIQLKVGMAKAAIRFLRGQMTPEYESIYLDVIGEYNELITKFRLAKKGTDSVDFIRTQRDLQVKAFQAERNEIQNLYEEGAVTIDVTRKIRKQINIREAYWMEETSVHTT
jgi:CPA1 family monovalent cation:H+ antiporter